MHSHKTSILLKIWNGLNPDHNNNYFYYIVISSVLPPIFLKDIAGFVPKLFKYTL